MTTITVTVDDEQAEAVKKILSEISAVKSIEENKQSSTTQQRIKKILEEAKGKNLFADIENPSEWQRQIRKEWDRDY